MSTNRAGIDPNRKPTIIGMSSADDSTIVEAFFDPTTHRQLVDALISSATIGGYSTVVSGSKSSTSVGKGVPLVAVSTPCKLVVVTFPANTLGSGNNIGAQCAIGGSNVKATQGAEVGHVLLSGANQQFYVSDASSLYLDILNSGDYITFNIFN